VGVDEPPPRRETPWEHEPSRRPEPPAPRGLSLRAKIAAGTFIGVLYAGGMSARGDVLPGVVGGILAGILLVLVLIRLEQRRRR
jgi:hypothetical protein